MKILIAYVPVLHRGYEQFFLRHSDSDMLLLFGPETISGFDWLKKDLRSLDPYRAVLSIRSWNIFSKVKFLERVPLSEIKKATLVVMPDEFECRTYAENFLGGVNVFFDSVKLRYDKKRVESVNTANAPEVTRVEALAMMKLAINESLKSPDWWLQVGAVIARNGEVLLVGYNEHKPTDREALFEGDPRSNFGRGVNVELTLADHAEKVLVGEAARRGISLSDSDLYITTFPCRSCACLVARAGIKRCFFKDGWVLMLESDKILRSAGVELFHIKI
jgi:dCMP deaminase